MARVWKDTRSPGKLQLRHDAEETLEHAGARLILIITVPGAPVFEYSVTVVASMMNRAMFPSAWWPPRSRNNSKFHFYPIVSRRGIVPRKKRKERRGKKEERGN